MLTTESVTPAAAAAAALDVPKYILAAECRVAPTEFGRILQGRLTPSADQAERIAARLGSTPEALFGN